MIYYITDSKIKHIILEYLFLNRGYIINTEDKINGEIIKKCNEYDKADSKYLIGFGAYVFKMFEDRIFTVNYFEEDTPKGLDRNVEYFTRLTITTDEHSTITKIMKEAQKNHITENTIFISDQYGDWLKYNTIQIRDLNTVYINKKIKDKLISDIENFVNSEDEYNRFGIPYKLTFLLTGIPGSGKTSLIKAICKKFKFNLYMLSFSKKFDNNSLIHAIKNIESESILLIEDIDCLFNKRTSTDDTMISFSNLLNVLDGILYKHGSIIFLTTNHPEKLDHALIRIGRIDNIFELNYPSKNDIKNLFFDLIKNDNNEFDLFYDYINDTKICMSAIVNFLFKHRKDWSSHIDELLNTNNLITRILGNENKNLLFS
jgi:chaperone BCS1